MDTITYELEYDTTGRTSLWPYTVYRCHTSESGYKYRTVLQVFMTRRGALNFIENKRKTPGIKTTEVFEA